MLIKKINDGVYWKILKRVQDDGGRVLKEILKGLGKVSSHRHPELVSGSDQTKPTPKISEDFFKSWEAGCDQRRVINFNSIFHH